MISEIGGNRAKEKSDNEKPTEEERQTSERIP